MIFANSKHLMLCFLGALALAALAAALVFGGVIPPARKPVYSDADFGPARIIYRVVEFSDLSGWRQDNPSPALKAFLRSCEAFAQEDEGNPANPLENNSLLETGVSLSGRIADWREPCAEGDKVDKLRHSNPAARRSAVRAFFEYYFQPVQILSRRDPLPTGPARHAGPRIDETGVFTGYYEPVYSASRSPDRRRQTPLYPRPDDLVEVNLGEFREELRGERIAGMVEAGRLIPYPDRRAIDNGALVGKVEPIAWLDPTDLFFLQIQGSGRLNLSADTTIRVGYAAQNGHPYTPIGRVIVERGILPLEDVTMQSIRRWLQSANPEAARELREQNASYVFFRELGMTNPDLGPLGAQGIPLTPERSLAVDRRFHALGAPVWVDIEPVDVVGPRPIQRLMIAQDTGGAIRGPVRGDVFWGFAEQAGEIAGVMNARGRFFILTPKSVAARLPKQAVQ